MTKERIAIAVSRRLFLRGNGLTIFLVAFGLSDMVIVPFWRWQLAGHPLGRDGGVLFLGLIGGGRFFGGSGGHLAGGGV